jgi:hypothetical protein
VESYIYKLEVVAAGLRFYSGTTSLTERSDLAITSINRGGLLIRGDDNLSAIVASGNSSDSVVVEQADSTDDYATWTDITDSHDAGPVRSVREI